MLDICYFGCVLKKEGGFFFLVFFISYNFFVAVKMYDIIQEVWRKGPNA